MQRQPQAVDQTRGSLFWCVGPGVGPILVSPICMHGHPQAVCLMVQPMHGQQGGDVVLITEALPLFGSLSECVAVFGKHVYYCSVVSHSLGVLSNEGKPLPVLAPHVSGDALSSQPRMLLIPTHNSSRKSGQCDSKGHHCCHNVHAYNALQSCIRTIHSMGGQNAISVCTIQNNPFDHHAKLQLP